MLIYQVKKKINQLQKVLLVVTESEVGHKDKWLQKAKKRQESSAVQYLVQDIEVYINIIEEPVITEELLEDSEIINMLQTDDMIKNDILNLDKENKEPPPSLIFIMEISIFEVMKIEAKKQISLDTW
ncbi:12173_t:CDS:2 [Ambispora leptoticha]|uniref:12173_t:CDS:1 n=1 Tax=Ambispora leptoticha TaxID=144679 RepID=A0A9N9F062_9GLOM|nr:12173_t:CDS:2 [Ambispora leptoticha]